MLPAVSSCIVSKKFVLYDDVFTAGPDPEGAVEVWYTASAILTLMQCVGLLHRFHKNVPNDAGIGVVMSGAVYLKLTGNTLVFRGAVSRLGAKGKMPFPFVVVHSGNTTIG